MSGACARADGVAIPKQKSTTANRRRNLNLWDILFNLTAHGSKQDTSTTVGQVAGEAEAVSFRLVKEITQG